MYEFLQFIAQNWGLVGLLSVFPLISLIVVTTVLMKMMHNLTNDTELIARSVVSIADNVVSTKEAVMIIFRMLTDVLVGVNVLTSQDENKEQIYKSVQANMQRYLNGKLQNKGN